MKLSRILVAALPIAVFVGMAVVLKSGIGKDPTELPSVFIDKPVPEFSLPLLSDPDTVVSRADLLGRTYFLNVWGSWCPTCQYEHPFIDYMSKSMGLEVIGLNWKDSREDAIRWLNQFGDPYRMSLFDESGLTGIDFGVTAAPETFLIGSDGTVLAKFVGQLTPESFERVFADKLQQSLSP